MEHLGAVAVRLESIPYVIQAGWEYDDKGFSGFPKRKGLDIQKLIDNGTHNLEIHQLESFVQAWLFFGLLEEFSV